MVSKQRVRGISICKGFADHLFFYSINVGNNTQGGDVDCYLSYASAGGLACGDGTPTTVDTFAIWLVQFATRHEVAISTPEGEQCSDRSFCPRLCPANVRQALSAPTASLAAPSIASQATPATASLRLLPASLFQLLRGTTSTHSP